jgi:hypothetical protein
MAITYAGISLTVARPDVLAWIGRHIPADVVREFEPAGWPGRRRIHLPPLTQPLARLVSAWGS